MQASQIPSQFPIPWGADAGTGYIRPIPEASQIGIQPGAASLTDGFPPLTFIPVEAGGAFPWGADANGILNQVSAWAQWQGAGAPVSYDSVFSTAIGGYPAGAWLLAASGTHWWLCLVDNNSTNPDTGGANWQYISYGQTFAGNPNGLVAGVQPSTHGLTQSLLWDTTNKILWLCMTTGNAAAAVWIQVGNNSSAPSWCGTSTGSANAQVVATPATMSAFTTGSPISWLAGFTNTNALTLTVGTFGTFSVYKSSITGPIALIGGEVFANNILWGRYDGTRIQLISTALGTAALQNASSNTGTVAAISGAGALNVGNFPSFTDVNGTQGDSGISSFSSNYSSALYFLGLLL